MSWVWVFVGFSLLIILHEGGHFLAAKATGMRVERFFLFFGPTIWSFKRGETEYGIKSIPLGGYVKITGMNPEEDVPPEHEARCYYRQPVWKRIVVVAAGPAVNIVLAFLVFAAVYYTSAQQTSQTVGEIHSGTPASRVLQPGDKILAVDGHTFRNLDQTERLEKFGKLVEAHKCPGEQVQGCLATMPVSLRILRDGKVQTISVRPEYEKAYKRTLIGFTYGSTPISVSPGEATSHAWNSIWLVTSRTASVFSRIFESEQRKEISSVVGISDVAHETVERSATESLLLLALVSLSLGLINLLPILPLDGGHIFWALVEKLRGGRPVSVRVMERASIIGFALVAMLFVIGLSNDIGRITGEGFNAR